MSDCTTVRIFGAKSFLLIFIVMITVFWLGSWIAQVFMTKRPFVLGGENVLRTIMQLIFSLPTPAMKKYDLVSKPRIAGMTSLAICLGISIASGFAASAGGVPHGGPLGWACAKSM